MNVEENRLRTFSDWPPDAVVSAARIAKAGFYYTKNALTVECFACKVNISTWNHDDRMMSRHKRLSPNCPFILNPSASGNIPYYLPSQSDTPEFTADLLKDETVRLQTYTDWPIPHIITPESLAKAGFYYLQREDRTRCAFCNGICVKWEIDDTADREHQRHFPSCPFVQTVINPRLNNEQNEVTMPEVNKEVTVANASIVDHLDLVELGVNSHKGPHKIEYATVESRLRTFGSWPEDLIQTPELLSQAGFYYEGSGDQVRCFHCDGGLRHWDPQDDPWTEHARWFPKCAYVQLVKGNDFVRACSFEQENASGIGEESPRRRSEPVQRREISDRDIQLHLNSAPGLTALSIGLHVGRVKQAIKEKLEQTGVGFATADALIEATLNLQREEEDTPEPHNIAQEATRLLVEVIQTSIPPMLNNALEGNNLIEMNKDQRDSDNVGDNETMKQIEVDKELNKLKIPEVLSLEEENRLLKEARLCKICMDVEVGIVFLPCGHLTTCVKCAPNLENCPVCRSAIKATVRTFLS